MDICDSQCGHIDMDMRKIVPMKDPFFDNLRQIMQEHTQLDIDISLRLQIKGF